MLLYFGVHTLVSSFAAFANSARAWLQRRLRDDYEPALHYMRGVGPKSQMRHAAVKHED